MLNLAFVALTPARNRATGAEATERPQTLALARAMAARGHRVSVYLPPERGGDALSELSERGTGERDKRRSDAVSAEEVAGSAAPGDAGARPVLRRLPASVRSPRMAADLLLSTWHGDRPDVIHAAGVESGLVAVSATESSRVPIVQDVRAVMALTAAAAGGVGARTAAARRQQERLATALCRRADHVVSVSEGHASDLRRVGVASRRLSVLPYGLLDPPAGGIAGLGAGRSAARILCPDGLAEGDGADDVIAALPLLPHVTLTIAGGPDPVRLATDRDAKRLRALARRLRVADRVELLGALPHEELAAAFRSVDLVVTVPRTATSGLTCLVAMSHGCAVVASWLGGARDAVLPGITGMLVPPADPRTLGRTVRDVMATPTMARSCGIAGADRAQHRYGWSQLSTDLERIVDRVLISA